MRALAEKVYVLVTTGHDGRGRVHSVHMDESKANAEAVAWMKAMMSPMRIEEHEVRK